MNTEKNPITERLTVKIFIIGVLILISYIASLLVLAVVDERMGRSQEAARGVAESWGASQQLVSPIMVLEVPAPTETDPGNTQQKYVSPDNISYETSVETEIRTRGIFEVPVYTATIQATGTFTLQGIEDVPAEGQIILGITDPRGVVDISDLAWNEADYSFEHGILATNVPVTTGFTSDIVLDGMNEEYRFAYELVLHGTDALNVLPSAAQTHITMQSDWLTPSFTGTPLPEYELTESGFTASWSAPVHHRLVPRTWLDTSAIGLESLVYEQPGFSVSFINDVDFYTQVDRTVKYAILFIALTFLSFFLFETLCKLRIHPIQYLLVGFALALFYLLLLAFAEHIGFLSAYVTASIMTIGLISGYSMSVLHKKRRAFSILALLIALYGYLYLLLQMEEYALLSGSILLFIILGSVMLITRKIDWYRID